MIALIILYPTCITAYYTLYFILYSRFYCYYYKKMFCYHGEESGMLGSSLHNLEDLDN